MRPFLGRAHGLLGLELPSLLADIRVLPGPSALLCQALRWIYATVRSCVALHPMQVWTMIVLYVVMGTAPMMLFGFIAVAGIVQGQLASIPVIRQRQTLGGRLRSTVLHTTCDTEYLNRRGAEERVRVCEREEGREDETSEENPVVLCRRKCGRWAPATSTLHRCGRSLRPGSTRRRTRCSTLSVS